MRRTFPDQPDELVRAKACPRVVLRGLFEVLEHVLDDDIAVLQAVSEITETDTLLKMFRTVGGVSCGSKRVGVIWRQIEIEG